MRVWCSGSTIDFQSLSRGPIPLTRSNWTAFVRNWGTGNQITFSLFRPICRTNFMFVQMPNLETLPVNITQQLQDGCVTASARSFISNLGVSFDKVFLPKLREYSLDESNPENNHMLGVAVVAADLGLTVSIHRCSTFGK